MVYERCEEKASELVNNLRRQPLNFTCVAYGSMERLTYIWTVSLLDIEFRCRIHQICSHQRAKSPLGKGVEKFCLSFDQRVDERDQSLHQVLVLVYDVIALLGAQATHQ
jgi:hypothetical protein